MSEIERRSTDRRSMERDSVRTNPEVMGRTEPRTVEQERPAEQPRTATEPVAPRTDGSTATRAEVAPEMNEIMLRFDQLQSEFIEDPRAAVKKAERLMEEAVDRITKSMRQRMSTIHRDVGDQSDTEHLRLAMREYRQMIYMLGGNRAA